MKQTETIEAGTDHSFFWDDFEGEVIGFELETSPERPEGSENNLAVREWRHGQVGLWHSLTQLHWYVFKRMCFNPPIELKGKHLMMLTVSNFGLGSVRVSITPKLKEEKPVMPQLVLLNLESPSHRVEMRSVVSAPIGSGFRYCGKCGVISRYGDDFRMFSGIFNATKEQQADMLSDAEKKAGSYVVELVNHDCEEQTK